MKKILLALFLLSTFLSSCSEATRILAEANRDERKIDRKEERKVEPKEEKSNAPTPIPTSFPKKKEDKKVRDVPLSGKIDPDGLPVSNNGAMKILEEKSFPLFFNVDADVTVRHRGLTAKQIETITKYIKEAKADFFEIFGLEKNEENANDDFTKGVIIDIFDNDALYQDLFPKLFDNKPYKDEDLNAGMCFENNPAFAGNLMRIALKVFKDVDGFEIINIKHEFTHYLDMRYNWAGVGVEPNDWWMEGLAEYIGNGEIENEKADIKTIKKRKFTLKKIMGNDNQDNSNEAASDQKYAGGRLVIKFMFDKHLDDINTFLEIIRNGEYDTKYDKWRKDFSNKYNVEFSKWIVSLK